MSSFFGCFSLGLMRLIRRPGRLLGLVLLPCLVLLAGLLLPSDDLEQPLEAGVCLPAHTPGALELLDILQQSDPQYVVFHAASEQEIYDHVSAGRWECGFVLSRDFETSYSKENPGRLATLVRARSSTLSPLLADVFSAALFHLRAPDLASGYAGQTGLAAGAALDELKQVVADGVSTKMGLAVQTIDGTAQERPHLGVATAASFCRGLCAVALFLYALLLAADLSACTSEGWFVRTAALTGRFQLLFGLAAAQMLAAAGCAFASFALGIHFFGSAVPFHAAAVLLYLWMLTGLALALGQLPGTSHWLPALLPFIPAVCLVLCPIFFDAGRVFPPAAPVSAALPPTWLLRALDGGGFRVLLYAGLISTLAALMLSVPRKRS